MELPKINILYVDDEPNNLISFTANLRTFCNVYTAKSAIEGRKILEAENIHIIITDQRMPDTTGVEFLESIIEKFPEPIRMLLTGYADVDAVIGAINKGEVYRYIMKPFDVEELKTNITDAYNIYSFRKKNKELLEKYRKIFEESTDAIFVVDDKGKLIDFNKATTDLLKYSRSQMQNITYKDLLENQNELEIIIHELKHDRTIKNLEVKLIDNIANWLNCLISITPVYDKDAVKIGYQGTIKDITKQKKESNMLVRTILNSEQNERNKFAEDLHDSISQQLASINFYIQTLQNMSDISSKNTSQTLAEADASLNSVLSEIRDLCYKIMPRTVVSYGLSESIRDLCCRIEMRKKVKCIFNISDHFPSLDKTTEVNIFRIVQELVNNSIEHGKASKISINISHVNNKLNFMLQDNGIGFNATSSGEYKGGGLKNIKARVESYNGAINIQSSENLGTSCKISIPITIFD